jgi:RNA polymerase sigma factor (sigma-70 family)
LILDEELVRAMADGDQAAFEVFIHRYHGPILGFLERMLADPGKAEDFTQETFVRLIRQLKKGEIPLQIRPWLYRVATNLCKDYWRSKSVQKERSADELSDDLPDTKASVYEIYARQESRLEIIQTLEEIPAVQKEIILLRFYQDLKLQEIADTLELSLSGVKSHLYNGLRKLKKRLDERSTKGKKGGTAHA